MWAIGVAFAAVDFALAYVRDRQRSVRFSGRCHHSSAIRLSAFRDVLGIRACYVIHRQLGVRSPITRQRYACLHPAMCPASVRAMSFIATIKYPSVIMLFSVFPIDFTTVFLFLLSTAIGFSFSTRAVCHLVPSSAPLAIFA